jgi:hypothetical protein
MGKERGRDTEGIFKMLKLSKYLKKATDANVASWHVGLILSTR